MYTGNKTYQANEMVIMVIMVIITYSKEKYHCR